MVGAAVATVLFRRQRARAEARAVCHPALSHLIHVDSREVLLIGTLPLDLDSSAGSFIPGALSVLHPDVVMVEGTEAAGLNAMLCSGAWELHGVVPPGSVNWTDLGDAAPVELPRRRPSGWLRFLGFGGPSPPGHLRRSLVPVKVRKWAHHLRGSVGRDVAAALVAAAASGVPVHFLGSPEGGFKGHALVAHLAQQASAELLEEEWRRGRQLPSADLDVALLRAESRVREDAGRWLHNVRGEAARTSQKLAEHLAAHAPRLSESLVEQLEVQNSHLAARILKTMEAHRKGVVVVAIDQWADIEKRLLQAGYRYVSQCA